jgi:tRNA 5-methylaminomethyl-2-thiouridine biosynthesis bifunctional protein
MRRVAEAIIPMHPTPWYRTPQISHKNKQAIIIGGGLAGTSAAYSLSKRGWQITLIERHNALAEEASGNPVGIINQLLTHKNDIIGEFYLNGFHQTLKYIENLQQAGAEINYNKCGVLELAAKKSEKNIEYLPDNLSIQKLSAAAASEICGIELGSGGLFNESAGWVNPAQICNAAIAASNVQTIFLTEILSLQKNDDWSVIDNAGSQIAHAPVVIIANANYAKNFTQVNWLPLVPVRGQVTYLPTSNSPTKTKCIICYEGGYITPEIGGISYLGATFNRNATDLTVSIDEHAENLSNLKKYLPIADYDCAKLQGRAAFRATSPDRRPIIGPVPDYAAFLEDYADLRHGRQKQYPAGKYLDGLYISTGHGSRGLTGCPLAAELLAAQINNEVLPVPQNVVDSLNPARFIIRYLKQI